jgi:hypothetical protein
MAMRKYICNTTCWISWKKQMYTAGDIVLFGDDEVIPSHFSCLEPPENKEEVKQEIIEEKETKEDQFSEFPINEDKPRIKRQKIVE